PVGRDVVDLVLVKDVEHHADFTLRTELAQPDLLRVVDGNHEGEILMGEPQYEVAPAFAEDFAFLKVFDDCRTMMGIDDPVSLTEHKYPLCAERSVFGRLRE